MAAKIIRLEVNVGCRHPANGVRFPHIYRGQGFEFERVDDEVVPGTTTPVEPFYALSDQTDFGIANPTFVPIKVLTPQTDKGWILVRHHGNRAKPRPTSLVWATASRSCRNTETAWCGKRTKAYSR